MIRAILIPLWFNHESDSGAVEWLAFSMTNFLAEFHWHALPSGKLWRTNFPDWSISLKKDCSGKETTWKEVQYLLPSSTPLVPDGNVKHKS